MLHWQPNSTRPPGQPRKRWINNIQETVRSRGSTLAEANNQRCWRRYTDRPLGLPVKRYKVLEEIGLHTALKVLLLLLLSRWARQVLPMKGRGSRRGEGTDAPKRWEILPSCRCAGKHLICQWSHQRTVAMPTLSKTLQGICQCNPGFFCYTCPVRWGTMYLKKNEKSKNTNQHKLLHPLETWLFKKLYLDTII